MENRGILRKIVEFKDNGDFEGLESFINGLSKGQLIKLQEFAKALSAVCEERISK